MACCSSRCEQVVEAPRATPVGVDAITGVYGRASAGPSFSTLSTTPIYVNCETMAGLSYKVFDGTSWVTAPQSSILPGARGSWWSLLEPPSTIVSVNSPVAGALPDAWANVLLSDADASDNFVVAGDVGTEPRVTLYNSALTAVTHKSLPGTPMKLSYVHGYIAVSGQDSQSKTYLVVYSTSGSVLTLLYSRTYEVGINSLSLSIAQLVGCQGKRAHTLLVIGFDSYVLLGELETMPSAHPSPDYTPPGNLVVMDLPKYVYPYYVVPEPQLLYAARVMAGVSSALYSDSMSTFFAVAGGSVIAWRANWYLDQATVLAVPFSLPCYEDTTLSSVESTNASYLVVAGVDKVVIYKLGLSPWY